MGSNRTKQVARDRFILSVTLAYIIFALAWIFLSDSLLSVFTDINSIIWLSTAKGVFFVIATAIGLFFALRAVPANNVDGSERLLDQVVAGLMPGQPHRWLAYSLTVAITLAMIVMRNALVADYDNQRYLVLFMFPIILSALLGGMGPGLLATVIAALGADYFVMPPLHDFSIATNEDLLHLGFLAANGIAVSLLSEGLRRAQTKSEHNLRLLDSVISGTSDAVFIKDTAGRYLLVNEAASNIIGKTKNEIIGHDDTEMFSGASAEKVIEIDRAIMANGKAQSHEEPLTTLDGSALVFHVTKGPVFNDLGKVVGMFGISRDITDNKMAESRLRNSEAFNRAILDSVSAEIAVLDQEGVILAVNQRWTQFALENSVEPGKPMPSCGVGANYLTACKTSDDPSSADVEKVAAGMRQVIAGHLPIFELEYPCHSPDQERWFRMIITPLADLGVVVTHTNITARKKSELALAESAVTLNEAQQLAKIGNWTFDIATNEVFWSDEMYRIFGRDRSLPPATAAVTRQYYATQEGWTKASAAFEKAITEGASYEVDAEIVRPDGSHGWFVARGEATRDGSGKVVKLHGTMQDISSRKQTEEQLHKLAQAVEQSPESIVITDIRAMIEYVNESFVRTSGYSRAELIGKNSRILQSGHTQTDTYASLWQTLQQGEIWKGEFLNKRKDGSEYIEHAIISPIRHDDGTVTHYVAVKEDISEKNRNKAEIHRLAYYDPLTSLPNRTLLLERIAQALAASSRNGQYSALMLFNIDRFKTINDAGGQALGDALLQKVAERLVKTLREADFVARMAGDEFGILLTDLSLQQQTAANLVLHIAEKIHHSLREPFRLGEEKITLTTSLGIALFPDNAQDSTLDVLRRANTALHHSKSSGGEQTAFFEGGLEVVAKQRFNTEHELHQAVAGGQLRVYLQPQVNASGCNVGAEALVRWQHPQRGLLPPGTFIPIAEESNLIIELGSWVLTEVCHLLVSENAVIAPMRISVNISPRHFHQEGFVEQIKQVLAETGADPARLMLEVTESMLIDNINDVIAKMNELSMIGIHFSLDDFGTGYSSLSHLKRLPIHEIKIDKTFVQDMTTDNDDASLVETILSIAKHLRLQVVAEGVETAEQAAFLNQRGEVIHQGYFFGRPMPIDDWLLQLKNRK